MAINKKNWIDKEIDIRHIFLDSDNPRHDHLPFQDSITIKLVNDEQVYNLAEDILTLGLSPAVSRIVVPANSDQKGKYIVLDGNRRLCALKLLDNPDVCTDKKIVAKFKKLLAKHPKSAPPEKINCIVFKNREDAKPWLRRMHSGALDGVGQKEWNSPSKTRFDTNENSLALDFLDYAKKRGLITKEEHKGFPLTTLTRYLNNPTLRNKFGFEDKNDRLIRIKQTSFDNGAKKILKDTLIGNEVNSRKNKEEINEYAEKLVKEKHIDPFQKVKTPIDLTKKVKPVPKQAKKQENPDPYARPYLIPYSFKPEITDPKLKRLNRELQKEIDLEHCPYAAASLLRLFIEYIVKKYVKKISPIEYRTKREMKLLWPIVQKGLKESNPNLTKNFFKAINVDQINRHSLISFDTLGAYMHGSKIPKKNELIDTWDDYQEILAEILSQIN